MAAPHSSTVVGRLSKRARTGTAHPIWRDWANLTAGPAGLIADQLLADDVTGYLRFRAVCAPWRRCTESPHDACGGGKLDSRFHPRRWIMILEVFVACPGRRDFLNVSTGVCVGVDLLELRDRLVVGSTSDGLLLLCGKGTGDIHLLNPLTKHLTPLPNATSTWLSELNKLQVCNVGVAGSSTIALHLDDSRVELAVARPDDEQWSCHPWLESDSDSIVSTLSFSNRFYCVTGKGIKAVNVTAAGQRPKLVAAVEDKGFYWLRGSENLVDNDGELIMVRPTPGKKSQNYRAHRVDLDAGKMVPINDLRGRAVLVCDHSGRLVSVHAAIFPSIRADTVYRCRRSSSDDEDEDGRPSVAACHVKKGWITWKLRFDRGSIEDYLSRYVCRSKDIVVPAPPLHRSLCWPAAVPRKRKTNSKVFGDDWFN